MTSLAQTITLMDEAITRILQKVENPKEVQAELSQVAPILLSLGGVPRITESRLFPKVIQLLEMGKELTLDQETTKSLDQIEIKWKNALVLDRIRKASEPTTRIKSNSGKLMKCRSGKKAKGRQVKTPYASKNQRMLGEFFQPKRVELLCERVDKEARECQRTNLRGALERYLDPSEAERLSTQLERSCFQTYGRLETSIKYGVKMTAMTLRLENSGEICRKLASGDLQNRDFMKT